MLDKTIINGKEYIIGVDLANGSDRTDIRKEPIVTEEQAYGNDCPGGKCDV